MRMARIAVVLLTWVSAIAVARAEVTVTPGVPFTASELVAALALRGAIVDRVDVQALSPTAVMLRTPAGMQRVEIDGARGPAAARLVALQLTLSAAPPVPLPAPTAVAPGEATPRPPAWTFDLTVGGGRGVSARDLSLAAARADAIATLGHWRWGVGVAWLHGLAPARDGRPAIDADLGALRVAFGVATGRFAALAGPGLMGYRVAGAAGAAFAAGGELRVRLPGGVGWHTMAGAQLDVFFHRVLIERDGAPLASTPRVAVTAMFGIAWGGA